MKTCIDAYKNINIELRAGNIRLGPCCAAPTKLFDSVNFFDNEYLKEVRSAWDKELYHSACATCKIADQNNLVSRRQGSNRWYEDNNHNDTNVDLIRIDFMTGDLCNLRCAICGPWSSSAWKQELNIPVENRKVLINNLWKNLNLEKLKFIHFNGGEPLLNKEHIKFLQAIPDKSKVHINYNTNGTIIPNVGLLELWAEFKLVQLDISIDDIGQRFTYQRYPAVWEEVVSNLYYLRDTCPVNCMFAINTSLGILNNFNYSNLLGWLQTNFPHNKLGDPVEFRTQLTDGLLGLHNYENRKMEILQYLDSLDQRRGTDWRSTFPELVNLL